MKLQNTDTQSKLKYRSFKIYGIFSRKKVLDKIALVTWPRKQTAFG
jgi:hypothetical protein